MHYTADETFIYVPHHQLRRATEDDPSMLRKRKGLAPCTSFLVPVWITFQSTNRLIYSLQSSSFIKLLFNSIYDTIKVMLCCTFAVFLWFYIFQLLSFMRHYLYILWPCNVHYSTCPFPYLLLPNPLQDFLYLRLKFPFSLPDDLISLLIV